MQGLQALDQFKSFVSKIGGLGRYEDTYIVHAAEGETVVPMEVLDQNPVLKKRLFKTMMEMGIEPGRYIVGNELNSKNPITGQPEFFFKRIKKALADISGYAAPIIGAMYGPAAGALAGGVLGSFKRENPGDPTQGLQMALLGGGSGIASNLLGGAKGMDLLKNTGLSGSGQFGTGFEGFKEMLSSPFTSEGRGKLKDYANIFDSSKTKSTTNAEKLLNQIENKENLTVDDVVNADKLRDIIDKDKKGVFGNMSLSQIAALYGLGTAGLGFLLDRAESDEDVGDRRDPYQPTGKIYENYLDPIMTYAQNLPIVQPMAKGGVMDLQDGGESVGPGTGTSDSIPAMLSDGEFVMTAKAVRGAGGGDRREGARKMYQAMDELEAKA
jgi:hypothetical protein